MAIPARYVGDDLVLRVTVNDDTGAAKSLVGATVTATAHLRGTQLSPTAIDTTGLATGQIVITWDEKAFTKGIWDIFCRVDYLNEKQMVFADTSEWRYAPSF